MKRRVLFAALALVALAGITGSATAGIVVQTDSGNIGQFSAINEGVSAGGTAKISFNVPNVAAQMNTVNGNFISPAEVTAVNGPITMLITPTGSDTYKVELVPPTYDQTIGLPGAQAELVFALTEGVTSAPLPKFFNTSGIVKQLLENNNPNFDFSKFGLGGDINITLTATSFTGSSSFATFFATPGATVTGNGSFSEAAAPEPASMALMGIGLTGLVFLRRFMRQRSK